MLEKGNIRDLAKSFVCVFLDVFLPINLKRNNINIYYFGENNPHIQKIGIR